MLPTRYNCPKCNRSLAATGEVAFGGSTLAVFQCDECMRRVVFENVPFDAALTFAVDELGGFFDPTTGDVIDPASLN